MVPDTLAAFLDRLVFGRSYRLVAGALASFGSLVLPSSCVGCGTWDTSLCAECAGLFRRSTAQPFHAEGGAESLPDVDRTGGAAAGRTATQAEMPSRSPGPPHGPLPVIAAGRYARAVSVVLLAYKNHGHVDLAAPIAAALAGALHVAVADCGIEDAPPASPVLLVPVPTRAASRRKRGYDPLALVLSRLDRSGRLPAGAVLAPAVRQLPFLVRLETALERGGPASLVRAAVAPVLPGLGGGQKGLGRRGRRAAVLHSMGAVHRTRSALTGRRCLIVDDVLTTGATIGEVHRVLVAGGARVVGAVVIAATASPAGRGTRTATAVGRPGGPSTSPAAMQANRSFAAPRDE